jgi:small subunit ribosomal protein S4e|tara:strand:- start:9521 stop:10213 length:693 start_codon:yes stop_codon:yes gene_type:complete
MSQHLSRLIAPKSWPIKRKNIKFIVKPSSGPHSLKNCIPLNILLKDSFNYANTTREVRKILNNKDILIDKFLRKDHRFPVGIMDVIDVPKTNESYRIFINKKGKFAFIKIDKENSNIKPSKIIGKTILKKKKVQLNLYDGKNILVDKDNYKVGDSLLLDLTKKKIKSHLKFEKDAVIYLTEGKYKGSIGKLEKIDEKLTKPMITIKTKDGSFETNKKYAFVIGDNILKDE